MSSDPLTYPACIAPPFSLVIPPTTYCPGSDVEGEVLLEFPRIQDEQIEDVVLEFRGRLKVYTAERTCVVSRELIHLRKSIWKPGSAYHPPESHVLRTPFRFHLPAGPHTLPSVVRNEWHDVVSIMYYVEVTAVYPAPSWADEKTFTKSVREPLVVVPKGSPTLCASIKSSSGREGGTKWKVAHAEQQMRRGLWGEYSTATVELLVPNEHGILPHRVPIPVRIEVKTATARLARAKADKHPAGKPIFPAIAIALSSNHHTNTRISISVHQTFTVHARGSTSVSTTRNEFVVAHVTEGDLLLSSYYRHWQADTDTDDDLNVKEETRRWVQHWTLQPTVPLDRFPPTFSSELVDCAYAVSVQVPFAGMGNAVKVAMPITLDSGIRVAQATPRKMTLTDPGRGARGSEPEGASRAGSLDSASDAASASGRGTAGQPILSPDGRPPSQPPTYFDAVFST